MCVCVCVCLVLSFDPSVRLYFCLILFPVLILVLDALDFLDFFRADFGTGKPVPRKLRRRCFCLIDVRLRLPRRPYHFNISNSIETFRDDD